MLLPSRPSCYSKTPEGPKALRGFYLIQWAWVDSNYRPHAYQISAERSWALVGARERWNQGNLADSALAGASQRGPATIQVLLQLSLGVEPPWRDSLCYSAFNTVTGSTTVALRAGPKHAAADTSTNPAPTMSNVAGSFGSMA